MPVALLLLLIAVSLFQQPATVALRAQAPTTSALDFEFFRAKVQPIFLARREGHTRCVSCHSKVQGTPMRLQALLPGTTTWNEQQSRMNFQVIQVRVIPRNLNASRLLMHPLAAEGGGDFYHSGGKHWNSILDPEWQTLANWVCGRKTTDEMLVMPGSCLHE